LISEDSQSIILKKMARQIIIIIILIIAKADSKEDQIDAFLNAINGRKPRKQMYRA